MLFCSIACQATWIFFRVPFPLALNFDLALLPPIDILAIILDYHDLGTLKIFLDRSLHKK